MKNRLFYIPILVLPFLRPWTFTAQGTGSFRNEKTSASSWVPSTPNYTAGNLLVVVCVAIDNIGTTDGDLGDITSVTDGGGNVYTKAVQFTNGQGSASAGATIAIYYSVITNNQGSTITFNLNGNSTAKALLMRTFSIASGNQVAVETNGTGTLANDGADAGSITLSSMTSREHLVVRACAVENNSTAGTTSSNYTPIGSTSTTGTSGGSASTNIWIQAEYRIVTSTSETTNPTTATVDNASAMVAFYEYTPSSHKIYLIQ